MDVVVGEYGRTCMMAGRDWIDQMGRDDYLVDPRKVWRGRYRV